MKSVTFAFDDMTDNVEPQTGNTCVILFTALLYKYVLQIRHDILVYMILNNGNMNGV